jgi:translation initiation factor 2 subunit 2
MKKKKKSSKKKAAFDMEAFEKELNESKKEGPKARKGDEEEEDEEEPVDTSHLDELDEEDLGENPFSRPDAPVGIDAGNEAWLSSDRDYTYPEVNLTFPFPFPLCTDSPKNQLLTRFYASLHAANPALLSASSKRYTIAPPSIHREGNKKTIFANVTDICKKMHRQVRQPHPPFLHTLLIIKSNLFHTLLESTARTRHSVPFRRNGYNR